jgi:hypothetical protein
MVKVRNLEGFFVLHFSQVFWLKMLCAILYRGKDLYEVDFQTNFERFLE